MVSSVGELRDRLRDFPRFAANHWKIVAKNRATIPFKLNSAQLTIHRAIENEVAKKNPARILVLKYRQCGASTYGCGLFQHRCQYWPGQTSMTIADKLALPQLWLSRAKDWVANTPEDLRPFVGASNQLELRFDKIKSR